jgi:hypothetical protein
MFKARTSRKVLDNSFVSSGNLSKAHLFIARTTRALPLDNDAVPDEAAPTPTTSFSPSHLTRISNRTLELYGNEEEVGLSLDSLNENQLDRIGSIGESILGSTSSLHSSTDTFNPDPDYISIDIEQGKEDIVKSYESLKIEEPVYKSQTLLLLNQEFQQQPGKQRWHMEFLWRLDFKFIISIFNPIPFFYPLTLRYDNT